VNQESIAEKQCR